MNTAKRPKVEAGRQDHSRHGTTSHEPIDIDEPEETSPRKKAKVEKNDVDEPKTEISQEAETVEGNTAEEILAKIKDAELPETEDLKGKPYQFFQKRKEDGPVPSGGVADVPEAKPNCLSGLTIIFTGVLPNLDRNDAENLAKQYGAKVTKSISGKTSLVVIGEDAGPSKVEKIKKFKIKAIDESGFLTLLRSMPSEGGSGDAAIKAKQKRELEEQKILEEAREEERKLASESQRKQSQASSSTSSEAPARVIPDSEKLWTVKYAPKDMNQLCGNKGQVNKLKLWLERWFDNAKHNFKNPGSDGSGIYRACLISGPPGIGKTSAAHLVARSLGLDVLEKNASDVRSKSLLNSTLKSALDNTSVVGFFKHQHDASHSENDKRFCLIMDEVDGMSSGDHGGTGTLSSYCKITKMPLILICNDKSLPKMRTFDRVTYDLPFRRPSEVEVKARLMTIAHREKIKLDPTVIGQLVQATSNDIRQMINLLSTVSRTQKNIGHKESKEFSASWQKHTILKPFDITARFFSAQTYNPNSGSSLNDKIDLYFNDIDFTPLMIQENYLYTRPAGASSPKDHLRRVAEAADDISKSDHINSLIRSSEQQWSLLPFHGVMSSVRPCSKVAGSITQRINFAGWLGQNSKSLKYQRLLQEIQYHTRLKTSTDKAQLRLDYLPLLTKKLTTPLIDGGESSIPDVISVMDSYYLTKEDWAVLVDLGIGPANGDLITKKIPTKVKTAFTRIYNAQSHPVAIYKTGNSVGSSQPSRSQEVDFEDVIADDTVKDEEEDQDSAPKDEIDTKKDKLIKEVKPKKPRKAPSRKAK
ncbi:Piso0_004638 [Millerozyma farinosa CBS 7064]|uniref:Replication factor C subunit 1 n=1 Tax=Pichia sorbitophila (strain ATCC MYA-4447 / BCRC 22081 / CBS 7064 / NBRC 10061 / NRRL Y-12695) TaxID=559304 RepID=G8Y606_PICSO|nr:Piso0_004638 [Millerozyma farinosa CBS 7064]CCE85067.1 Piso0_004638 [Millerozyma farinosa CBS 7064]